MELLSWNRITFAKRWNQVPQYPTLDNNDEYTWGTKIMCNLRQFQLRYYDWQEWSRIVCYKFSVWQLNGRVIKYCNSSQVAHRKCVIVHFFLSFFRCCYICKGVWSRLQEWLKKTELRIVFFHQLHRTSKNCYLAWPLRVSIVYSELIIEKISLSICFILSVAETLAGLSIEAGSRRKSASCQTTLRQLVLRGYQLKEVHFV